MIAYPNTKLMCSINVNGGAGGDRDQRGVRETHHLMNGAIRVRTAVSLSSVYTEIEDGLTDFNEVTR